MISIATPLTRLLGIRRPILLAGMAGGPTTPELVGAVSRAGGLGVFGVAGMTPDAVRDAVSRALELADGAPVGVNVLISPAVPRPGADPDAMQAVLGPMRADMGLPHPPPPGPPAATPLELVQAGLEAGASVVATGLGDPAPVAAAARDAGAPLIAMVSTVDDARTVVDSGADVVVAQGAEAGGHRSNLHVPSDAPVPLVGTMALVRQVVAAVDVPVVATGGIMDGAGLAAALALGASGVQLGTALLVAHEAGVPAGWRERIRSARDDETIVTRALSGRPARGLPNALTGALDVPGAMGWPQQNAVAADIRRAAAREGDADHMSLWAGQAAALAGDDRPAAEIIDRIMDDAVASIRGLGDALGGAR
jgi:nitronate monooxygenase